MSQTHAGESPDLRARVEELEKMNARLAKIAAEAEENEERFRLFTEQSIVGVMIIQDDVFKYVNRRWCEIAEVSEEELLSWPPGRFATLIHPEDRALVAEQIQKKQSGDPDVLVHYEARCLTPNHRVRWLENYSRTVTYQRRPADLAFVLDVSDRRRLQERSRRSEKLEAIGRLAGGVAHDFNNLLTVVEGNLDLASHHAEDDPDLQGHIAEIRSASRRAAELTAQLLAFARRQMIHPIAVDPNERVRDVERMLRRLLGERIELKADLAADAWTIRIDPGQFEQLLINLAVNARDAMPEGGVLSFETRNVTYETAPELAPDLPSGSYLRLRVMDTGIGIESDVQAHVFEPFFSGRPSRTGTGLGLATCHGIVNQNKGHISLESTPGQGTSFTIHLPRSGKKAEPIESPLETPTAIAGDETILFVEDEAMVRKMGARVLRDLGYHVLEAASGSQALEVARSYQRKIHLLFTDVVLPDLEGPEIASRLRSERPGLPVLLSSGYTETAIELDGTQGSGVEFLPKPYSPERVGLKIRQLLDGD